MYIVHIYLILILLVISLGCIMLLFCFFFFFQAEDGIRDAQESRGLGDVYKRQVLAATSWSSDQMLTNEFLSVGLCARRGMGDDNISGVLQAEQLRTLSLKLTGLSCLSPDQYSECCNHQTEWHKQGHLMLPEFKKKIGDVLTNQTGEQAAPMGYGRSLVGMILVLSDTIQFMALSIVSVDWSDSYQLPTEFFKAWLLQFPDNWSSDNYGLLFGLCAANVGLVTGIAMVSAKYIPHGLILPAPCWLTGLVVGLMHLCCFVLYTPVMFVFSLSWSCTGAVMSGDPSVSCHSSAQSGYAAGAFFLGLCYHLTTSTIYTEMHWISELHSSLRHHPSLLRALIQAKLGLVVVLAATRAHGASAWFYLAPAAVTFLLIGRAAWKFHPWEGFRICCLGIAFWSCCCAAMELESGGDEWATRCFQGGTGVLVLVLILYVLVAESKWCCYGVAPEEQQDSPAPFSRANSYTGPKYGATDTEERQMELLEAGAEQERLVVLVAEQLQIRSHDALALLQYHRFDHAALVAECEQDANHVQTVLQRPATLQRVLTGMVDPFIKPETPVIAFTPNGSTYEHEHRDCSVCYANAPQDPLTQCQSGHLCCVGCLTQHVQIQFNEDPTQIQCPGFNEAMGRPCLELIPRSVLQQHLEPDQFSRYELASSKRFVQAKPEYQMCPFDDCDAVVFLDVGGKGSSRDLTVTCSEGHRWCWNCAWKRLAEGHSDLQHAPSSCRAISQMDALTQLNENDTDQATLEELAESCKRCPFCHRMVHRFAGCPHMTCRPPGGCGNQFCWDCLEPWRDHNPEVSHTEENLARVQDAGMFEARSLMEQEGGILACHRVGAKRAQLDLQNILSLGAKFSGFTGAQLSQYQADGLRDGFSALQGCYAASYYDGLNCVAVTDRQRCMRRVARIEAALYKATKIRSTRVSIKLDPLDWSLAAQADPTDHAAPAEGGFNIRVELDNGKVEQLTLPQADQTSVASLQGLLLRHLKIPMSQLSQLTFADEDLTQAPSMPLHQAGVAENATIRVGAGAGGAGGLISFLGRVEGRVWENPVVTNTPPTLKKVRAQCSAGDPASCCTSEGTNIENDLAWNVVFEMNPGLMLVPSMAYLQLTGDPTQETVRVSFQQLHLGVSLGDDDFGQASQYWTPLGHFEETWTQDEMEVRVPVDHAAAAAGATLFRIEVTSAGSPAQNAVIRSVDLFGSLQPACRPLRTKDFSDRDAFKEYMLCALSPGCLLYTSDAADEEDSVDLGGRRIIKKKKKTTVNIIKRYYI
eukprot:TRINITY_DN8144_c0_g1_i5.p1 TRINITY_DN8144_c0_g1~~TRINITY_DN8144_c0_g1_i5.p1  ORF type:complete len:1263 (-),score=300.33 TRINITY_DN8144_c0_g1_i5:36-3824(-)